MAKTTLGPDRIVAAALSLVDRSGVEGLSMRRLGTELGVEAMSLYHYFPHKESLLDALADAVYGEVLAPPSDRPWREALRRRCESLRTVLRSHPWAVGLIGARKQPGPQTLAHLDRVLGCLRSAGLSWAQVGHAIALLDAYVLGFAVQEQSLPLQDRDQTAEAAAEILVPGLADRFPHLAAFIAEHALQPGYDFGREFDVGLDLVLRSLGVGEGVSDAS